MQFEFARPWVLILIPILVAATIAIRIIHQKKNSRMIGEIIVRCIVLILAVLALSGISIKKVSDITTTVFLIDMSDSVKSSWSDEAKFVEDAIAQMPDKNQVGIVAFGADAKIEQFVTDKKAFINVQSKILESGTNIEQAVSTAMALFPDGSAKRMVILTDGAENSGNVAEIATSVSSANIEIKIKDIESNVEEEVYVSDVSIPETISEGDQFDVTVDVVATEPANATVSLYSGRTLKGKKDVALQKGDNHLVFSDQGVESGIKSYRVVVESDKDTVSINNTYSAFTKVEAPAKILLVEGAKDESLLFQDVLKAANVDYEVVSPSGVPGSISDMLRYQSVILLDVYADDLRKGFMDILETYVKDYAGGLAAIGGTNSYALGNYRNTPIEDVLPVKMDLEGEKQIPKIAMVMVIDHSGSMESPSTMNSSISCLNVAKQAAVNSLGSLREIDEIGVIAFDDKFSWAVNLQPATDLPSIEDGIAGILGGGGTSIYPAVAEAVKKLEQSDAAIKHVVLLTDGQDGFHDYDDLISEMSENNITLSSVAIGQEADAYTLGDLAEACGGRYYYSDAGTTLPRIFAQEVYLSTKEYLINEEFTPVITNTHDIIAGVFDEGSPSLLGYIASSAKDSAKVILESHKGDPILACWQCGLGHTVAWTSDGTNRWTGNFAGWDNYVKLWRNIIDWTVYDDSLGDDTLFVEQKASSAVINYETEEYNGKTKLQAVITDEEGKKIEASLNAIAPGRYQAEVALPDTGVYSMSVRKEENGEVVKNLNTATAMQYSKEYRYADVSSSIGNFVNNVSGKYISKTDEVFDTELEGSSMRKNLTMWMLGIAVFMFVIDIVIRRMHIDFVYMILSRVKLVKLTVKEKKKETSVEHVVVEMEKTVEEEKKPEKVEKKKAEKKAQKKAKKVEPQVIDTAALLKKKEERNL